MAGYDGNREKKPFRFGLNSDVRFAYAKLSLRQPSFTMSNVPFPAECTRVGLTLQRLARLGCVGLFRLVVGEFGTIV